MPTFTSGKLGISQVLGVKVRNREVVIQLLPFGLSPAPWAFARVIDQIKYRLHSLFITNYSYIDDFILLAKFPE